MHLVCNIICHVLYIFDFLPHMMGKQHKVYIAVHADNGIAETNPTELSSETLALVLLFHLKYPRDSVQLSLLASEERS